MYNRWVLTLHRLIQKHHTPSGTWIKLPSGTSKWRKTTTVEFAKEFWYSCLASLYSSAVIRPWRGIIAAQWYSTRYSTRADCAMRDIFGFAILCRVLQQQSKKRKKHSCVSNKVLPFGTATKIRYLICIFSLLLKPTPFSSSNITLRRWLDFDIAVLV